VADELEGCGMHILIPPHISQALGIATSARDTLRNLNFLGVIANPSGHRAGVLARLRSPVNTFAVQLVSVYDAVAILAKVSSSVTPMQRDPCGTNS
jgi:hypothetical protein